MTDCVQHPETLNVRAPASFESSMSFLVLAIGQLERSPPTDMEQINRLRREISRIDTATSRAARAVQLGEER